MPSVLLFINQQTMAYYFRSLPNISRDRVSRIYDILLSISPGISACLTDSTSGIDQKISNNANSLVIVICNKAPLRSKILKGVFFIPSTFEVSTHDPKMDVVLGVCGNCRSLSSVSNNKSQPITTLQTCLLFCGGVIYYTDSNLNN